MNGKRGEKTSEGLVSGGAHRPAGERATHEGHAVSAVGDTDGADGEERHEADCNDRRRLASANLGTSQTFEMKRGRTHVQAGTRDLLEDVTRVGLQFEMQESVRPQTASLRCQCANDRFEPSQNSGRPSLSSTVTPREERRTYLELSLTLLDGVGPVDERVEHDGEFVRWADRRGRVCTAGRPPIGSRRETTLSRFALPLLSPI